MSEGVHNQNEKPDHCRKLGRTLLIAMAVSIVISQPSRGEDPGRDPGSDIPLASIAAGSNQTSRDSTQNLVLGVGDLIQIDVFDVPELSRQYRVNSDGYLSLPLVSQPIPAAGRTPEGLVQTVSATLRAEGLVSHPEVTIEVKESRLRSVVVGGAVQKPQVCPLFGKATLLDVLAKAGGLSNDAGSTVTVSRDQAGADCDSKKTNGTAVCKDSSGARVPTTITINLRKLMEGNDPSQNVDVYPGDRVTVQRAGIVYVVGAVNRPGGFPLTSEREQMTVLKALALAEDLKPTAIRRRAMVIRPGKNYPQTREEISLNLKNVLAGRSPDISLRPNDILFIPDSTSSRALRRAAEAAVEVTTGVIIWRF